MKNLRTILLIAAIPIALAACGSETNDVPSLGATPTPEVVEAELDDEAKMMAFVQCMADEGIEFQDPIIDSDGNVQRPQPVEGFTITRAEMAEPFAACQPHLEGLTFGRERRDDSARLDQMVEMTTCLRQKGYDVDDPTVESFQQWGTNFRAEWEWDDDDAMAAYEECNGGGGGRGPGGGGGPGGGQGNGDG